MTRLACPPDKLRGPAAFAAFGTNSAMLSPGQH